jgi:hypothetical protein
MTLHPLVVALLFLITNRQNNETTMTTNINPCHSFFEPFSTLRSGRSGDLTISLNQYAHALYTRQGFIDAAFHLATFHNYPMDI